MEVILALIAGLVTVLSGWQTVRASRKEAHLNLEMEKIRAAKELEATEKTEGVMAHAAVQAQVFEQAQKTIERLEGEVVDLRDRVKILGEQIAEMQKQFNSQVREYEKVNEQLDSTVEKLLQQNEGLSDENALLSDRIAKLLTHSERLENRVIASDHKPDGNIRRRRIQPAEVPKA